MNSFIRSLGRPLVRVYRRLAYPRFYDLMTKTRGMLAPGIYKEIYESLYKLPDLDVVEVGGAAGSGSISAAWGMLESGKKSHLIVIERCEGGSRARYGDYNTNLQIILDNFRKFGVLDQIVLFPYNLTFENQVEAKALIQTPQIAGLVHDADGRLDRDFAIFYPLLTDNGLIIVDDYENIPLNRRQTGGDTKKLITYRLLNQLLDWELVKIDKVMGNTVFGHKPIGADFSRFSLERCAEIVRTTQNERAAALSKA